MKNMVRQISQFLFLSIVMMSLASCNIWKKLPENSVLLSKNVFHFEEDSISSMGKEITRLTNKLNTLDSLQKPNSVRLGLYTPLNIYYRYCLPTDTSWLDERLCNTLGSEKPSFYSPTKSNRTSGYMKIFLQNEGYIDASVTSHDTVMNRKARSDYYIELGRKMTVLDYHVNCNNRRIDSIVVANRKESYLLPGSDFSQDAVNQEKSRIISLLRNSGYALINQNNIQGPIGKGVDSLNRADVNLNIVDNSDRTAFLTFKIGDITINKNYESTLPNQKLREYEVDSIHFLEDPNASKFKDKHILNQLTFKPGQYYSLDQINETRKKMNRLTYFKYIQIRELENKSDSTLVNYQILLKPDKKYTFDSNFDVNLTFGSKNLRYGGSLGASLIDRNLLGGSENLRVSFDAEVLFNTGVSTNNSANRLSILNISPSADLTIPRFNNYLRLYSFLKNKRFKNSFKNLSTNAVTSVNLNYQHQFYEDLFETDVLNANYGIKMSWANGNHLLSVSNLNFSYFNPKERDRFQEDSNPLFDKQFEPSLSTSFILGELIYRYHYFNELNDWSYTIYNDLTLSGLEVSIFNLLSGNKTDPTFRGIEFNQRIGLDQYHVFQKNWTNDVSLFYRLNVGIVRPFGTSKNVPFINQFMLGGVNSMRAWQRAELGVGGFFNDSTQYWADSLNIYYQTADFKVETNIEYMFELPFLPILDGALFMDVGNIWNINSDNKQSNLSKDFYKQLAVGMGAGIRFDVQIFLLRLDLAFKVRNPYPDENGSYYVGKDFFDSFSWRNSNFRIALNLPFSVYD